MDLCILDGDGIGGLGLSGWDYGDQKNFFSLAWVHAEDFSPILERCGEYDVLNGDFCMI